MRRNLLYCFLVFLAGTTYGQDSTINNLVHTKGYKTAEWGKLGEVKQFGKGAQEVILLPGWGFDRSIFEGFIKRHENDYHMWAITFPGFGSTQAPPMPEQNENYRELNWTKGIIKGLVDLIDKEKIVNPIIVSCFSYANLVAMRLALDHPDKISKVVVISGISKFTAIYPSYEPRSLEGRIAYVEKGLAAQWFKTVTTETWNKGNFTPGTFTKDTVRAYTHWKMMSSVPIPVMVRYLCEFYCTDLGLEYDKLTIPTLVLVPAFSSEFMTKPEHNFVAPFFHYSWLGALPASKQIQMLTLTDTHAFIMDDQPEKFDTVLKQFIEGKLDPFPPVR